MEKTIIHHPSSYRDPSGFIFTKEGTLYRQVNRVFAAHYDYFISSGCYQKLTEKKLLIPHQQLNENLTGDAGWHTTLIPEPVAFISCPYEWSFDMLKDAALLTLQLVKETVSDGLILKDATPYNIQWHGGKLVFIDTLSFEKYNEEEPWVAYRQFCENFLGPLLLMHYRKQPLQQLQLAWPDGIPLDIIRSLLPGRSRFSLHTYLHIHLNARISAKKETGSTRAIRFSKQKMLNLVASLETLIKKLHLPGQKSAWSEYYKEASSRENYLEEKKNIIREWLEGMNGIKTAADLGANEGEFSRLPAAKNIYTITADLDPFCINNLYLSLKKSPDANIQPLIADLANPSPAIGVNNRERDSLFNRIRVDICMALALIHHLAIGKNIPLHMIAGFLRPLCKKQLIIEFVPKTDEKVKLMLSSRKDIYSAYTEENFRQAFEGHFSITRRQAVGSSGRILYLMTVNES